MNLRTRTLELCAVCALIAGMPGGAHRAATAAHRRGPGRHRRGPVRLRHRGATPGERGGCGQGTGAPFCRGDSAEWRRPRQRARQGSSRGAPRDRPSGRCWSRRRLPDSRRRRRSGGRPAGRRPASQVRHEQPGVCHLQQGGHAATPLRLVSARSPLAAGGSTARPSPDSRRSSSGSCKEGNSGSRIAFGTNGLIYMTTGGPDGDYAQELSNVYGKVLRLKTTARFRRTIRSWDASAPVLRCFPSDTAINSASPCTRRRGPSSRRTTGRTAATK